MKSDIEWILNILQQITFTFVYPRFSFVGFVLLDRVFSMYCLPCCPFLLTIVLSLFLRLTDYDYPCDIFHFFLKTLRSEAYNWFDFIHTTLNFESIEENDYLEAVGIPNEQKKIEHYFLII